MKQGITRIVGWDQLGAELAQQGDEEQALFLAAFCNEVRTYGTRFQEGMQIAAIASLLSNEDKELLSGLSYEKDQA